jgi:hypothetical protein
MKLDKKRSEPESQRKLAHDLSDGAQSGFDSIFLFGFRFAGTHHAGYWVV